MARIAIVGAGCAGLGAAATLLARGHAVVIFEALDRIGGRAWTSDVQGLPVDLGPQFVQDPSDNPWTGIMTTLGIGGVDPVVGGRYRILGGDGVWTTCGETAAMSVVDDALNDGFAFAEQQPNRPPLPRPSVAQPGPDRQERALALGSNPLGAIAESVEPWQYVAADSARQIAPEEEENNIYVVNGIGNLVIAYATRLREGQNPPVIRTQTPVTKLVSDDNRVIVTLAGEQTETFDHAIVTVPVTQIAKIDIDPPLEPARRTALGLIGLGSYKKIAFRPTAIPPDIEEHREYYIYDPVTDGCWQFFRLPTDPGILICVAAGDFARRLDEAEDDSVWATVVKLLGKAYATDGFTPASQVLVTNWTRQPYIGGAYSYTRFDPNRPEWDSTPLNARLVIAEPHGRIHFAGEATWADAYGTIAGAYRSGQRAAEAVMREI